MYICIYVWMYVCMCVCVYVYVYVCVCVNVCMCVCVCMYACMCACMYACMHVCMHACMDVWMYVCMYYKLYIIYYILYVCVCVCVFFWIGMDKADVASKQGSHAWAPTSSVNPQTASDSSLAIVEGRAPLERYRPSEVAKLPKTGATFLQHHAALQYLAAIISLISASVCVRVCRSIIRVILQISQYLVWHSLMQSAF